MPYQANEAVLHTDASLLPRRRRAWASWNYHLLETPTERATVTYHMNRLQSLQADRELCVTLNRTAAIDPAAGDPHDPLRPSRLHRRMAYVRRRATRRSAGATALTTAAPTGVGAFTRTACAARLLWASISG